MGVIYSQIFPELVLRVLLKSSGSVGKYWEEFPNFSRKVPKRFWGCLGCVFFADAHKGMIIRKMGCKISIDMLIINKLEGVDFF